MAADFQLFAVYAQEAAERLLLPTATSAPTQSTLSPREPGTPRWTMVGKTAQEVGDILAISERTLRGCKRNEHFARCALTETNAQEASHGG